MTCNRKQVPLSKEVLEENVRLVLHVEVKNLPAILNNTVSRGVCMPVCPHASEPIVQYILKKLSERKI